MVNRKVTTRKKIKVPEKKSRTRRTAAAVLMVTQSRMEDKQLNKLKRLAAVRKFVLSLIVVLVVGLAIYLTMTRLVIAWVDRRPVWWFEYYSALSEKYGGSLKQQLINEQLVEDEARNRHVSASQQEVNSRLQAIVTQEGGQSNLDVILAQQGLSVDELKKQIMLQILVNKMFGQNVRVTGDEVNQYIQDNKSQFPDVNDTVRSQVRNQLEQQKVIEAFQAWLAQAEKSNRVIRTQ